MSVENTSKLIEAKKEILLIENELQRLLMQISRRKKIDFERTSDYGQRGFVMQITFDEINTEAFDNVDKIKELWKRFVELRKIQKQTESQFNVDNAIERQIKEGLR